MKPSLSQPSVPAATPEASTTKYVIEARGLGKVFGTQRALSDVNLNVPPGTIGLLGPNGAGKTTLIKCLLNLEAPTEGSARVLGRDIREQDRASRERVGYGPEMDCHISGMFGCEYVTYCGQLSGMSFRRARQRAHEILDFVGMGQERYRSIDTYSTGMRQRVKLAQALVHDPELIFLDEPTNGLDPSGREYILRLIGSLWKELRISVVISSHLLHDVERICDRVIIIANGRVLEHEAMEVLKNRHHHVVELAPASEPERFVRALSEAGLKVERLTNGRIRTASATGPILEIMRAHDLPPAEIVANPNALHELFLQSLAGAGGEMPPPLPPSLPNPASAP